MIHQPLNEASSAESSWYALRVLPRMMILSKRERTKWVNGTKQIETHYVFPAEEALAMRGLRPFVPTEGAWRRRSRYYRDKDRQRVRRPLLTGYILIDPPEGPDGINWFSIMNLAFVTGVIVKNGRPARISKTEATRRDHEGNVIADAYPRSLAPILSKHTVVADEAKIDMPTGRAFEVGDTVEMFHDPLSAFQDLNFRVKEIEGDKAQIIATLFGADIDVEVDTWKLAKVVDKRGALS